MVYMVKVANIMCTQSTLFDVSIAEMNLQSLRSTFDLDSDKSQCFNHRDEFDSTVYIARL